MSDQSAQDRARADEISRNENLDTDPAGALSSAGGAGDETDDVSGYGLTVMPTGPSFGKGGDPAGTAPQGGGGVPAGTAPQGGGGGPTTAAPGGGGSATAPQGGGVLPTPPDGGSDGTPVNW